MPTLIVMTQPDAVRQLTLQKPETTLGRAPINDIVIDTERVSRFHAVLTVEGPFVSVRDLDSRNGTLVNGVRVAMAQVLVDGDTLDVGGCLIRYLAGNDAVDADEALRLMTTPGLLLDIDRPKAPAVATR